MSFPAATTIARARAFGHGRGHQRGNDGDQDHKKRREPRHIPFAADLHYSRNGQSRMATFDAAMALREGSDASSLCSSREDPIGALVGSGDGRQRALSATRRHQRYETGFPTRGRPRLVGRWQVATLNPKVRLDRLDIATHPHVDARDKTWRAWCNRRDDHLRVFPHQVSGLLPIAVRSFAAQVCQCTLPVN